MEHSSNQPISLGDWMLTLLLTFIPIVNIIMLLVWAFGSATAPSKANWAKALLLWFVILFGLSILLSVIGGVGMMSMS